jgi:hypothetical protein
MSDTIKYSDLMKRRDTRTYMQILADTPDYVPPRFTEEEIIRSVLPIGLALLSPVDLVRVVETKVRQKFGVFDDDYHQSK